MSKTSPKRQRLKQICGLFLLLGLIAVLVSSGQLFNPKVTISGLSITDHRDQIHSTLSNNDFRSSNEQSSHEGWHRMDTPSINVTYDQSEIARKIQGGIPQINGQDVRHWTLQEVEEKLGLPQHASKSREIDGRKGFRNNLSYPQHRLLVQQDSGEIEFILFASGRKE